MRVRHFGFLANRCRGQRLPAIRTALAAPPLAVVEPSATAAAPIDSYPCPTCRTGRLRVTAHLAPAPWRAGCRAGVTTRTEHR